MAFLEKWRKEDIAEKKDSWSFILTKNDLFRLSGTEDIEIYIWKQQRNYLAHIVRHDDESLSKRLLFEKNPKRAGRHVTMEKMVYEHEKVSQDAFNRLAIDRWYWIRNGRRVRFGLIYVNLYVHWFIRLYIYTCYRWIFL